jgi:hypothetical protein
MWEGEERMDRNRDWKSGVGDMNVGNYCTTYVFADLWIRLVCFPDLGMLTIFRPRFVHQRGNALSLGLRFSHESIADLQCC